MVAIVESLGITDGYVSSAATAHCQFRIAGYHFSAIDQNLGLGVRRHLDRMCGKLGAIEKVGTHNSAGRRDSECHGWQTITRHDPAVVGIPAERKGDVVIGVNCFSHGTRCCDPVGGGRGAVIFPPPVIELCVKPFSGIGGPIEHKSVADSRDECLPGFLLHLPCGVGVRGGFFRRIPLQEKRGAIADDGQWCVDTKVPNRGSEHIIALM